LSRYIYEWKATQYGTRLFRRPGSGPAPVKAKAAKAAPAPALDLSSLKKDELVAQAEAQGVDTSGTKADIIERLEGGSDEA
jgi:hypothetical protein